jgi:Spy/CpxP family protein refolding chaperone
MKSVASRIALVVAGLVVALAGTLTLSAYAQPGPHADRAAFFAGGPHGHGPMMGRMIDHMLDSVNATEQQRAQVKEITKAAAADLKAQHEATRGLHEQMMQAFAQPTVDANAVEALRQKQLAAHDQISKRMTQAMLDVSRVLTPEQRKTLADKMTKRHEMMQRHMREMQELEGKPRS